MWPNATVEHVRAVHRSVAGGPGTPAPPPVLVAAAGAVELAAAARVADVVLVPLPPAVEAVTAAVAEVRAAEVAVGRAGPRLRVLADVVVSLGGPVPGRSAPGGSAVGESVVGGPAVGGPAPGGFAAPGPAPAAAVSCSPEELAELLVLGWAAGLDGFRLRPAALPADLLAIVDGVVPALQRRGVVRTADRPGTLRDRLGLSAPAHPAAPDTVAV